MLLLKPLLHSIEMFYVVTKLEALRVGAAGFL
jgi:hypothetical protein